MAKILVVDDEPQMRATITEIIRSAGHEVIEATDGLGALLDIKEHKPDLVLLDWMIPELTGGEVIQKIRGDREYASVSETIIVVVSDFDGEESHRTYEAVGANEFVAKRDDPRELKEHLLRTVDALLKQKDDLQKYVQEMEDDKG